MKRSILGVLLVLTFVAVGIASAPPLTFTFSDVHANKTATETDSYGVNNAGVIAGDYVDSAGVQHAMILAGTKLTTVNNSSCEAITGTTGIAFYAINSANTAVGWCTNGKTFLDVAFTYAGGKFTAVNFPKSKGTQATGINDKGWVTGLYLDSASVQHGFVKKGSKYTSIDVTGDTSADAYGINNAGDITVFAINSSNDYDAFIYNGKTFKKVGYPKAGPLGSVAHATNNKGAVTGTYYDSAGDVHGWLLDAGKYYAFNDPTGCKCDTRSDGINDKLEMVGRYSTTLGGASFGFKVTVK
ncbi:MAG TPA: hypothetical protein VK829_06010 [Terriglobales bacterium]|nr:hypothetical protein [Terriglobales bacterium]